MVVGRIANTIQLNKFRRINDQHLKKNQLFIKNYKETSPKEFLAVCECAQIININAYDFVLLSYKYCAAKKEWDKIFYARIMAVSLNDFFDNVFYVMNQDLVNEIQNSIPNIVTQKIKTISKNISVIKKEIGRKLTNIRNITFAHKTRIPSDLYAEIFKIDHHEIFEYTIKIINLITELNLQLIEVLNHSMKKYRKTRPNEQSAGNVGSFLRLPITKSANDDKSNFTL